MRFFKKQKELNKQEKAKKIIKENFLVNKLFEERQKHFFAVFITQLFDFYQKYSVNNRAEQIISWIEDKGFEGALSEIDNEIIKNKDSIVVCFLFTTKKFKCAVKFILFLILAVSINIFLITPCNSILHKISLDIMLFFLCSSFIIVFCDVGRLMKHKDTKETFEDMKTCVNILKKISEEKQDDNEENFLDDELELKNALTTLLDNNTNDTNVATQSESANTSLLKSHV